MTLTLALAAAGSGVQCRQRPRLRDLPPGQHRPLLSAWEPHSGLLQRILRLRLLLFLLAFPERFNRGRGCATLFLGWLFGVYHRGCSCRYSSSSMLRSSRSAASSSYTDRAVARVGGQAPSSRSNQPCVRIHVPSVVVVACCVVERLSHDRRGQVDVPLIHMPPFMLAPPLPCAGPRTARIGPAE